MSGPIDAREFRRRLDDVLRQRNSAALRDFLIASGQWDEENTPADLDRAMWMMIAASAGLREMHEEARTWLVAHGFASEAQAILGRGVGSSGRGKGAPQQRPRGAPGSRDHRTGGGQRPGTQPPRARPPQSGQQPGQKPHRGVTPRPPRNAQHGGNSHAPGGRPRHPRRDDDTNRGGAPS